MMNARHDFMSCKKCGVKARRRWLVCERCGVTDKTRPGHVGTSVAMRDCTECAGPDRHVTLCRACCPTGHGTRFPDELQSFGGDPERSGFES